MAWIKKTLLCSYCNWERSFTWVKLRQWKCESCGNVVEIT